MGSALFCGKLDPKAAALAALRFQPVASAHAFGAFADQRQSNAGARIGFLAVQALKQAENLFMMLTRDANAVVLDPDADKARKRGAENGQAERALRGNEFHRIADEIGEDLF